MEPTFTETELLTTGEMAALLGVTTQHVRNLCDRGVVPYVLAGSHRRIRRSDFEALQRGQAGSLLRDQLKNLWLHQAVAGKLVRNPERVLKIARRNISLLRRAHPIGAVTKQFDDWERLLNGPLLVVLNVLASTAPHALELRQNSPFAGALTDLERAQVLNAFRAELSHRVMRRDQLEHLLRAASTIVDDRNVIVFGSQAILGSFAEQLLPPEAIFSIEADITFFNDVDEEKADMVDGAIGELSTFHETYGIYAQGVSISTAVLPEGWQDRVVIFETAGTKPGRGLCLEPHDLAISKLVAARDKDRVFTSALLRAGLVDHRVLVERVAMLNTDSLTEQRILNWLAHHG